MAPLRRAGLTWQTLLHSFILFSLVFNHASAGIVNRTIDDAFGDSQTGQVPIFLPGGGVWADPTCGGCAIKADTSKAFKGTYKAATYTPELGDISITMDFEGTDIYVFFILANNQGDGITTTTVSDFAIDGQHVGNVVHSPDLTTTDFQYNALVFSHNGLPNGNHTLNISTSGVDYHVYVNFDYAIYTHVDSASLPAVSSQGSATAFSSISDALSIGGSTGQKGVVTGSSSVWTSSPSPLASAAAAMDTISQTTLTPSSSVFVDSNSGSASSQNSMPVGAIAGSAVGGAVIIGLLITVVLLCRRRHFRVEKQNTPPVILQLDTSPQIYPRSYSSNTFVSPDPFASGQTGDSYAEFLRYEDASSPSVSSAHYHFEGQLEYTPSPTSHANSSFVNAYQKTSSDVQNGISLRRTDSTVSIVSGIPGRHSTRHSARLSTKRMSISTSTSVPSSSLMEQGSAIPQSSSPGLQKLERKMKKETESRQGRQTELEQRMRTLKEEMRELRSDMSVRKASVRARREAGDGGTGRGRSEERETLEEQDAELSKMRDMIKALKEQVEYLRAQQRNELELSQGMVDEPPPEYTPH